MGLVLQAWAAADADQDLHNEGNGVLKGIAIMCSSSRLFSVHIRNGPLCLELALRWCGILWSLSHESLPKSLWRSLTYYLGGLGESAHLKDVFMSLPISNQATRTTNAGIFSSSSSSLSSDGNYRIKRFEDFVLHHNLTDNFFDERSFDGACSADLPPTLLVGSWHDCFIEDTMEDYTKAVDSGCKHIEAKIYR